VEPRFTTYWIPSVRPPGHPAHALLNRQGT